jgi:hypothetical protein
MFDTMSQEQQHHLNQRSATMFDTMSLEQKQRFDTLPPDKLNEVVNKWYEQRQQQLNGNLQAGRPQMPIHGLYEGLPAFC